jgi:hypothetical protein
MRSSSSANACPEALGSFTSRFSIAGTWTTARSLSRGTTCLRPFFFSERYTFTAMFSDLLRRCGNGWLGSTASGVRAGNTFARK